MLAFVLVNAEKEFHGKNLLFIYKKNNDYVVFQFNFKHNQRVGIVKTVRLLEGKTAVFESQTYPKKSKKLPINFIDWP